MNLLPIQICSLEAVREFDTSLYDGVITDEDSDIEDPFRVDEYGPDQLDRIFSNFGKAQDYTPGVGGVARAVPPTVDR